jgi:hypothetical protein
LQYVGLYLPASINVSWTTVWPATPLGSAARRALLEDLGREV